MVLLMIVAKGALAAHPLVTDDTSTQGHQNSQLELNSDWARSAGERAHAAAFTYSYGASDRLDVYANFPMTFSTPSGKGDVSIGMKWRFWQDARTSLALKPEVFFPTGDESRGLGNGRTSAAVVLLASHGFGPWTVHGNVGLTANRYKLSEVSNVFHQAIWRVSGAVAYAVSPHWTVMADTGIARNAEKAGNVNPVFILFAAIYSPQKNIDLDMGIKGGLNAFEVDRQLGAGVTIRY